MLDALCCGSTLPCNVVCTNRQLRAFAMTFSPKIKAGLTFALAVSPRAYALLHHELKRRNVYPVIMAYAIVVWILLQIGEVVFEPLGLPGWAMTGLVIAIIVGFPVVLVLSWIFDFTPNGIQRDTGPRVSVEDRHDRPSIAVLPFVDMSPHQDQGYFCDGVAEEILTALTKLQQLHVVARSSSFQYRDGAGDIRKIGTELGAIAILEGSVRISDNRIRITAQLVEVSDGFHVWSRSFDEELKDVFELQDRIAESVAESLLETITPNAIAYGP